nr:methionine adenosyltransferase [Nanoarchaeum sp.]
MENYFITSESVTEGHPDKICDQISDEILDELLAQDPKSRVAVETLVTTGSVHVAGEITTSGFVDVQETVRRVLREIGYTNPKFGIDYQDAGVWVAIHKQSPEIAMGVNNKEQGAGDQGMMYGFACNETRELMPMPIIFAHKLTRRLAEVRKKNIIKHLGPDGKSQVTVQYVKGRPKRIDCVVIAQQHTEDISENTLRKEIFKNVIKPICGNLIDKNTKIHINATGRFVIGGPEGDTGVTGRKIIVDSYGGVGRHGGGAFSGKDPSKVDRSGAYMARYVAKNIVAAGLADKCEIQVSYVIGVARPSSINVECFGTNKIPEEEIMRLIFENFDMTPRGIIEKLDLLKPIYRRTAAYGHFGRNEFSWEQVDKAQVLREKSGLN